jgi:putative Ca2+/H+ antiporter (TMEM165/GDT1 family)
MWQMATSFFTIFFAELGDKTQLATVAFAAEDKGSPWQAFLASAGALVLSAAISTILGEAAGKWLQHIALKLIAGICFIAIGGLSIVSHYRSGG